MLGPSGSHRLIVAEIRRRMCSVSIYWKVYLLSQGLVASLPARSSNTRLHGAFKRPTSQSYGRASSTSGRSWLVAMAHSMSDSQKESSAGGESAFKQELLRMRNKVCHAQTKHKLP